MLKERKNMNKSGNMRRVSATEKSKANFRDKAEHPLPGKC
jgi:hypothetical protein